MLQEKSQFINSLMILAEKEIVPDFCQKTKFPQFVPAKRCGKVENFVENSFKWKKSIF